MAVHKKDLALFTAQLQALKDDIPEIMDTIAVGEGVYAVKQARLICKNDSPDIVNTGDYRRNWKSDRRARRSGKKYVYSRDDPEGGMFVGPKGGYVRGHFTMKRAVKRTLDTQQARVTRKIDRDINNRMK